MTTPAHTPQNCGVCHALAQSCLSSLKEAANTASTERFISLATRQIEESGQPATPELVAASLHTTLKAISAISSEFQGASNEPK